jgi:proteic killer suppression protein
MAYHKWMIRSFACKDTAKLFNDTSVRRFTNIEGPARRKLMAIHAATRLEDLLAPPGNRLEALKGNRSGQHSIRINVQWRICFEWKDGAAWNVEIIDYH